MPLARVSLSVFLGSALLQLVSGLGCVGTISGIPPHPPNPGTAAAGAHLSSLATAAIVDPTSPENLIIPVEGAVCKPERCVDSVETTLARLLPLFLQC